MMPQGDPMVPGAYVGIIRVYGVGFSADIVKQGKSGADSKSEALGSGTQIYVLH